MPRASAARAGCAALGVVALGLVACERLVDRMIERNLTRVDVGVLESPDLQVVLCGTGSPICSSRTRAACGS